jgi:hypothetical protein
MSLKIRIFICVSFLNNQPDALIIQILFCYKILQSSSILNLLGNGHQNLHETYQCRMYSRELLMMGRVDVRNM